VRVVQLAHRDPVGGAGRGSSGSGGGGSGNILTIGGRGVDGRDGHAKALVVEANWLLLLKDYFVLILILLYLNGKHARTYCRVVG
jgi:hypothetical protein